MNTLTTLFPPLNEYFDHIYVITIKRAVERQEKIREVLDGLQYELLFGADKNDHSLHEIIEQGIYDEARAKDVHRYSKPMTLGQICCSWSHRMVYEDMVAKNYNRVLILEDDVVPIVEGLQQFSEIVKELPEKWDLLYFDYFKNDKRGTGDFLKQQFYHLLKVFGALKWTHKTISHLYARPYSQHLHKAGYHDYASAYSITRAAAKKIIELQTPIIYPADHVLPIACTNEIINGFISIPKVFLQRSQTDKANAGSYVED